MTKTKKIQLMAIAVGLGTFTFITSCNKDEVDPPCDNCEEELITSAILEFEDMATGDISEFAFRDPDGFDGGGMPTEFDTIKLDANAEYHVTITLLNESISPEEDITVEVEEEGLDHQFFFTIDPSALVTVAYDDTDANGNPIGIHTLQTAGSAGNGTYTLTLKHQPGIKDGSITTGETDVEVEFILEVD